MLNQERRSLRGALGVTQVLPQTAAAKPINMPDITTAENNIFMPGPRCCDPFKTLASRVKTSIPWIRP